jgi:hypothetical protein
MTIAAELPDGIEELKRLLVASRAELAAAKAGLLPAQGQAPRWDHGAACQEQGLPRRGRVTETGWVRLKLPILAGPGSDSNRR